MKNYVETIDFAGPSQADTIDSDVSFYALSLDSPNWKGNYLPKVEVMHSDECFRHFLLNTTDQAQLTRIVNQTATNVRRTFPVGLMTDASMLIANPAFGDAPSLARNFTNGAYHGTVVWSWQLAMMAKGMEYQLGRCSNSESAPEFCSDVSVYGNLQTSYNVLWDSIEANSDQLGGEVWSWDFYNGQFHAVPLGTQPPPPGIGSQTGKSTLMLKVYMLMGRIRYSAAVVIDVPGC